jgi:sulfite reductase (NADPH) flavoprotein alpha-component
MLRRFHALAGLAVALALLLIASTGALLSLEPALNRLQTPAIAPGVTVADLAGAVAARHVRVDAIRLARDGALTATYNDGQGRRTEVLDPATGAGLGPWQASAFFRFVADLHRSLLLGDGGRIAVAATALAMLALCLTGAALFARGVGGFSRLLKPLHGGGARRLHAELGRIALAGLLVSSLTGLALAAATFDLIPGADAKAPEVSASGGTRAPVAELKALAAVDVVDLKSLKFPARGDAAAVFTLRSEQGEAAIDPATGAVLAFAPTTAAARLEQWALALHGAQGLWGFALFLGFCSTAALGLGASGLALWLHRRRAAKPKDFGAEDADTIILVGSENNSTWGFAHALQRELSARGFGVHAAAMNAVGPQFLRARRWLILTATYGDGGAPASATHFLERLAQLEGRVPVAVLGFGDRNFEKFCGFAQEIAAALDDRGFPRLLPMKRIDRGSAQEFAEWTQTLGAALGCALRVEHVAQRPRTKTFELVSREIYGEAVGAPVAILRFTSPKLPEFEAGDLLAVQPPGGKMPRFYSLASSTRDGFLELCVRLQPGGLCSAFLHGLAPGEGIAAFIRQNPGFRPAEGLSPLILIGAGAGIAPLAGFVRANAAGRPMHLYWGGRSPSSDFLYEHELARSLAEKRLTALRTAFSRHPEEAAYVQDRIAADAHGLRALIMQEAQILVCGGRDMAHAVRETLEKIVHPLGLDLATLRTRGRYLEDVF